MALGDLRINGDTLVTLILTMDRVREHVFDKKISQAWQEAGRELRIRVTAPFNLGIGGDDVTVEAFIRDFAGPDGSIAVSSETSCFRPGLMRLGYFVSDLFPSNRVYSREHFIATLDDWRCLGRLEKNRTVIISSPLAGLKALVFNPIRIHQTLPCEPCGLHGFNP